MNQTVLVLGEAAFTLAEVLGFAAIALGALALSGLVALILSWRSRVSAAAAAETRAQELEARLGEMARLQSDLSGRLQTVAEVFGTRQADMARALSERLDSFGMRLGENVQTTARATHDSLSKLAERLAVIDSAQKNLTELSQGIVGLQEILANKQRRGAFGQGRMEAIVADGLPAGAFTFQATLSNGRRPDCLIHLPNDAAALVVDAKFPLESFNAFREAETPEQTKAAAGQLRTDVLKHVTDIRDRYHIPGETQDLALMFVPSESAYADLHEHFEDVMQKAYRARVVIVGPSLLMLAIQVVQAMLRDERIREQAHLIQSEVARLVADVHRLGDRVGNLRKHFAQAGDDIAQIATSADKIVGRGRRIEGLDFDGTAGERGPAPRLMAGE